MNFYLFSLALILWICEIRLGSSGNSTTTNRRRTSLLPFKRVCYKEIGCFDTGPPFQHPIYRPLSIPPLRPELQRTIFYLYTTQNKNAPLVFSPAKMEVALTSRLKANQWTRILVHGLFDGVNLSSWMKAIKDLYLENGEENVILVDYGIKFPPLSLGVANARVIGAQIWLLINFLNKNFGIPAENVHVIGHGLGAQIAGYAGERLNKLGRITGLDPFGPYFRSVPNNVKLEPSDALYVDIIHSNPGRNIIEGFGTNEDVGHVNFWPGGGRVQGCPSSQLGNLRSGVVGAEVVQNALLCRHFRAHDLFRFSFNQHGCLFVGVDCPSYEEFFVGRCNCGSSGEKCRLMGQFSTPTEYESRYYLQVGKRRPYCLHQYQVIVYVEVPIHQRTYGRIHLTVNLVAEGDRSFQEIISLSVNLMEKRQFRTFLLTFNKPVGRIHRATAAFEDSSVNSRSVKLEAIEINYLYPLPKEEVTSLLCKQSEEPYNQGKQTILTSTACNGLGHQDLKDEQQNYSEIPSNSL